MLNQNFNFVIPQGDDVTFEIPLLTDAGAAFDPTGYTAKLQGRVTPDDADALIDLDSEATPASIVLASGKATLVFTHAVTGALDFDGEIGADLQLTKTADSTVVTPARGKFRLRKEYTKEPTP